MSDLHRARVRAEAFAHAVDHGPRHSSRLSDDPELMDAVELVGRLRTAGAVAPRPEFTAELRHRLLEQAAARAAMTPTVVRRSPDDPEEPPSREGDDASVTPIPHRHGRHIRLVASTAALVMLGGGIGSAAAAQQAMPGDTLYGMKRSIENVSTNVGVGDDSRGRRDLQHAMTRLDEVRGLVATGGDVTTINSTLADFSVQARKGVSRLVASYQQDEDATSITAVTTFITGSRQVIGELAPKLPPESLKAAVEALATIEQLAQHADGACPRCDKPKPAKIAGQATVATPQLDPTIAPSSKPAAVTSSTAPRAQTSAAPPSKVSPDRQPATSAAGKTTTLVPPPVLDSPSGVPSKPVEPLPSERRLPSLPSLPSLPTSTPSSSSASPNWPWPFPTLSTPLKTTMELPDVVDEGLLPPWR